MFSYRPCPGEPGKVRYQIPVSYTHLDVYKRQLLDNQKKTMRMLCQTLKKN